MKKVDASFAVEATFVMITAVLLISSITLVAMNLHSHAAGTSQVRMKIESNFSKLMTGQISEKSFKENKKKEVSLLWPLKTVSYNESAERTYVKAVDLLYGKRIANKVRE